MHTFSFNLFPTQYILPPAHLPRLHSFPAVSVPASVPIPKELYTTLLDVRVPLTIAVIYAVSVHLLNQRSTGQPYAIAKTRAFKTFIVMHNVFLAVYSAWTFYGTAKGMYKLLNRSTGIGDVATSLCKVRSETRVPFYSSIGNGTSAAVSSEPLASTVLTSVHVETAHGLWEESIAFYGWLFYLSKFYEVVDTAIIILKGRKSSILQTYHHTGAMFCMWIGIRYMTPGAWIFCLFNSFIHSIMYTYYTFTALRVRVPQSLKRSLTSIQITQFFVGGSFTFPYLFGSLDGGVPCLSNTGEAWAVIANVTYLMPLTYLFLQFFFNNYIVARKKGASTKKEGKTL